MKTKANLMHLEKMQLQARLMHAAQRCSAMSKRSKCRCQAPAVKGKNVCRMHGARAGAPKGKANGSWRHGGATLEAMNASRYIRVLVRCCRSSLKEVP